MLFLENAKNVVGISEKKETKKIRVEEQTAVQIYMIFGRYWDFQLFRRFERPERHDALLKIVAAFSNRSRTKLSMMVALSIL